LLHNFIRFSLVNNIANTSHLEQSRSVSDPLLSCDAIQSIEQWKQETLNEIFEVKYGAKTSLPVLATEASHAMYWGKQMVTNTPDDYRHIERPTYVDVHLRNQKLEAQRYRKRNIRSAKQDIL
jgi:hypothetical protein